MGITVNLSSEVFPARAGMSPVSGLVCTECASVPRASGDEPVRGVMDWLELVCSPRERG